MMIVELISGRLMMAYILPSGVSLRTYRYEVVAYCGLCCEHILNVSGDLPKEIRQAQPGL